jgi:rare lipoprotein A
MTRRLIATCAILLALMLGGPADAASGMASWYGPKFHGKPTASGEAFDQTALTAAHRTLPFGSRVRVRDARTGRSVVVRINDRGPFAKGRVIDLSKAAARKIGLVERGVGRVTLEVLDDG